MVDQPASTATLLTGIAAVINAIAWPAVAAIDVISSFQGGHPDRNTLDVSNGAFFLAR